MDRKNSFFNEVQNMLMYE